MQNFTLRSIYLFCICFTNLCFSQVKFSVPITGVQGQDYFIVNHVDHDTSAGLSDFECKKYTYNNHMGTDFVLRSFKQMDSGAYVLAAAYGIVIGTVDSLYDRNKNMNVAGFGNYIVIAHGDSTIAYYAHLKKYSLRVKFLDTVYAGDTIAEVGASGFVTDPHLHFEVYRNSTNIDPFSGPCASNKSSWITQPKYDTAYRVIDHGFVNFIGYLDTFKERPENQYFYDKNGDSIITFWIHQTGMKEGDSLVIDWEDLQNGIVWYTWRYKYTQDYAYSYFWTYIYNPAYYDAFGVYRITYKVNGVVKLIDYFEAINAPSGKTNKKPDMSLQVFANRDENILYVSEVGVNSEGELLITDITGREIAKLDLQSVIRNGWNYGNLLPEGVYCVNIRSGFQIKKIKLLL